MEVRVCLSWNVNKIMIDCDCHALSLDSEATMADEILLLLYLKILYNKCTNCSHKRDVQALHIPNNNLFWIQFSSASCCQVAGTRAEVTMCCWIDTITYERKQSLNVLEHLLQLKGIRPGNNIQPCSLRYQPVSKNHTGTCCQAQQQIYGPEKSTKMH